MENDNKMEKNTKTGINIDSILKERRTLSFEVFPPKPEMDRDLSGIRATLSELCSQKPDFVSVTYGAGGNNRPLALDIAKIILSLEMLPLSHLTAVGYTRGNAEEILDSLAGLGVANILALRGDLPKQPDNGEADPSDYKTACDLADAVARRGDFCMGAAAYPEGHPESISPEVDLDFMKQKIAAGVTFFITQLFFNNDDFKRFAERAEKSGIKAPILAGIMPVLQAKQIRRIIELSGCSVPIKLDRLLERYRHDDASMTDAGMDYAAEQISGLWEWGVRGVHIYTMNRAKSVLEILNRCGLSAKGAAR